MLHLIWQRRAVFLLAIFLALALLGCSGAKDGLHPDVAPRVDGSGDHPVGDPADNPADGPADGPADEEEAGDTGTATTGGPVLDVSNLQPGDQVGTLTVEKIVPFVESQPLSEGNVAIKFNGQLTLTGEFYHAGDFDMDPHSIWFGSLEPESDAQMPRLPDDARNYGFLVTNYDEVKHEFGPPNSGGRATIVVEEYIFQRLAESDAGAGWATVTKVLSIEHDPPPSR